MLRVATSLENSEEGFFLCVCSTSIPGLPGKGKEKRPRAALAAAAQQAPAIDGSGRVLGTRRGWELQTPQTGGTGSP